MSKSQLFPMVFLPSLVSLAVAVTILNKAAKHRKCSRALRVKIYKAKTLILKFFCELEECDIGVAVKVSVQSPADVPSDGAHTVETEECESGGQPLYLFEVKIGQLTFHYHLPVKSATFVAPDRIGLSKEE